jgi:hypothetical protein
MMNTVSEGQLSSRVMVGIQNDSQTGSKKLVDGISQEISSNY